MDTLLWPCAKLETLLQHPEPTVQEWAVAKLFQLYPQRAADLSPQLLRSESPELVKASLAHLGRQPRQDLVPLLQELYMQGPEAISAGAIRVLGDWRSEGAIVWMRERIFMDPPLVKEQILAMIYALGRLSGDEAYSLLKQTETGIQDAGFQRWDLFYAALLQHRRLEDAATLLQVVDDAEQTEKRRRDALALLLAELDPGLNPAEVFFANPPAVRKYALERMQELRASDVAGKHQTAEEVLGQVIEELIPERIPLILPALQRLVADLATEDCFEKSLCRLSVQRLADRPGTDRWSYGLAILALSGILTLLQQELSPAPPPDAPWPELLNSLLSNRPLRDQAESYQTLVMQAADRDELIARLLACLQDRPGSWGTLQALDMLGKLQAVSAARSIISTARSGVDASYLGQAQNALIAMGPAVVSQLIPFLTASPAEKSLALGVLGRVPTQEGLQAILTRLPALYDECPEAVLGAIQEMRAADFLLFLENEYRPGSWELAQVYVQVCRTHQLQPSALHHIEQDLRHSRTLWEENRRLLQGESTHWPQAIYLELACSQCRKRYSYEIHELHLHPQPEAEASPGPEDMAPYRQGVVIVDDLRCKKCGTVNSFLLTEKSLSQLTTESIKLIALQKGSLAVPSHYPLRHVQLGEREGKPLTLTQMEQEQLNAVRLSPAKPAAHLALGKFYEYVKRHGEARHAYLQSLDLDARAVEAMAGLARLDAALDKPEAALQWIQSCYDNLDQGHLYLAQDAATFKKVVRQKRREFTRKLGIKGEEKQVDIRFHIDSPDYPKNRPCPCGSGKKTSCAA